MATDSLFIFIFIFPGGSKYGFFSRFRARSKGVNLLAIVLMFCIKLCFKSRSPC